jgi:hypothetical protein
MIDDATQNNHEMSEAAFEGQVYATIALDGDLLGRSGQTDDRWMYSHRAQALTEGFRATMASRDTAYTREYASAMAAYAVRRLAEELNTDDIALARDVLVRGIDDSKPSYHDRSPEARAKTVAAAGLKSIVITTVVA